MKSKQTTKYTKKESALNLGSTDGETVGAKSKLAHSEFYDTQ